ncbi:MAG: ABC transporter ATP-binding protein [Tissierellia bacterium]|nr:ABC transporter ATP-binding protein [Tissierellia bacterium]
MSKNIKNEEVMGKAYDARLMKRLLEYAKPYWKLLLTSLLLLGIITALELLNPYLLKITIDVYINGYKKPMYETSLDTPYTGIEYQNKKYIRKTSLDSDEQLELKDAPLKKIIKDNKDYYIVDVEDGSILKGDSLDRNDYLRFRQGDISGINKISIVFFLVILFTFIFNYIQTIILNYTSQKIIFNIREDLFNHIQSLSIGFFDKNPIGRLLTRVTNDTETLNEMYTSVLITLFKDLLMLVGIAFVMLKMDYKLALLSFSLVPLILIISMIFRGRIRVLYRRSRAQLAIINSSLNENITGIRTIQIFNKQKKVSNSFDTLNNNHLETQKKEIKTYAIFRPSIEIIRSIGMASLIYFGGGKVISNAIEFGVLFIFIDYLQKFFAPIIDLTEKYNILQSAMASSERIFNLLDNDDIIESGENLQMIEEVKGKIEFKNVWFAYVENDWVLKDISFVINPGEAIAFVGATGAGKSSIINLITRFYDIQKGEILLDGVNIKNIDKFQLRKNIGVVLQDVFVFTGTIEDNIRLNNKNIDQDQVVEVAKFVNAHNFICKLPLQYKEPVMERGSTLSSGERQLLAFARTLAHDPKILILDEATSNIDTETELLIQDALVKLIEGRTTIAVAHRLSTIQHADKIIVLSKGKIVEMGNHQELLKKEAMYYDLYKLQYSQEV